MRDEPFHTDREVGEFIEGLRASSRGRKRDNRSRFGADNRLGNKHLDDRHLDDRHLDDRHLVDDQPSGLGSEALYASSSTSSPSSDGQNADLLAMIRDMENQLQILTGAQLGEAPLPSALTPRSTPPMPKDRARRHQTDYSNTLDRIESQLRRVDQALGRNARQQNRSHTRTDHKPLRPPIAQPKAPNPTHNETSLANKDVNLALRQIMERVQTIAPNLESSLHQMHKQDETINRLRDDVATLRDLLERANYSGASELLLNEIAALSGRIDSLSHAVTQSHQDPRLIDAIGDIHSLLDRPAQDPTLNAHFDRILAKLDGYPWLIMWMTSPVYPASWINCATC